MNETKTRGAAAIMVAAADGLTIQVKSKHDSKGKWTDIKNPTFNWEDKEYRVKPGPAFRPYTWEEFAIALREHGPAIQMKFKTATWETSNVEAVIPCSFNATTINYHFTSSLTTITYEELCGGDSLLDFRWAADKTPCGILVIE